MGRGHTGLCRTVTRFGNERLRDLAAMLESELGSPFKTHGATLKVRPIRISHLRDVGEGVQLDLSPHDPQGWMHWGDFESDVEVRRRPRFSRSWRDVLTPQQVEAWLRHETESYLAQLRSARSG